MLFDVIVVFSRKKIKSKITRNKISNANKLLGVEVPLVNSLYKIIMGATELEINNSHNHH
jgi:hypothetical protein